MRIWTTFLALAAFLAAMAGGPLRAEPSIVFGPSPRALDNQTLFAPDTVPVWQDLHEAGVREILLNGTFLMPVEFRQNPGGTGSYPARPEGSYLRASDLRDLARLQHDLDLRISYEAGAGLSGKICKGNLTPAARGRQAALQEFDQTVLRLEEAGIQVAVLNVDGPFLRLIEGSRKRSSCEDSGQGFGIDTTVRTVQAYLKTMRDLVARANPDQQPPQLRLVVNLPNWQLRGLPRRGGGNGVDLADVLTAFADLQAQDPEPIIISEIVVDYPYALVLADPDLFRDRNRHLWNASRGINGAQEGPDFGYITNSLSYANPCLDREARPDMAFLPYLRGGRPISAACQRAQTGEDAPPDGRKDSDADYLRDSLAYADALRPGGVLADQLVVRDGTAIPDHVAHFYMQSWGMNPMRNLWFADRLADHLQEGR
ncbi:hypothetical protein GIY56_15815 [Paracoccus sp. YIM 132242]|uniref:Uncharacterized protein n=1 Tax=Paracoccus lichenicola TaxID=2665644 RepID=A0A6L6HRM3_9RHOB|nr:hypothetical protein [Paracoccus lichenicola]MTE01757.1 hypothetical protein [Paracoccus lichenicola]